ncbi:hypothetical protein GCM10010129_74340 [Streptomyces fumigatiscleroticus]|nr:hypothetical protein GCM10010129_74340 [Streptomyces fumigatiscleroticus]
MKVGKAPGTPGTGAGTRMVELSREEALTLLAGVDVGRVGFTQQALPAIRPVSHLVHRGAVVIRTHAGSALLRGSPGLEVVAYEADDIDPRTGTGWSVLVTGVATRVTDAGDLARYTRVLLPWADGETAQVVRIVPELVTGYRLEPVRS